MTGAAGPAVIAVVVAHASRTRLTETLRSLGEQTYRDVGVVVAAIGDIAVPDTQGVRPTVVRLEDPMGFATAVMRALEEVELGGSTYLLLLHDDVSLDSDAVERMVAAASADPSIAAVGAKLVEWFQPETLQEVGAAVDRFAIRRSALDLGEIDHGQRDSTTDVLFCSDACLLVRRDAFEEIGGLDEDTWPFYEDVDLCWRLRGSGARVVVEASARARHAADLSRGRRLLDTMTLRRRAESGRLSFMLRHYSLLGLVVILPQLLVISAFRVAEAVVRRQLWQARITLGAWLSAARDIRPIMRKRRRAPRARVGDRELLALAARTAAGDVRGERSEWLSGVIAGIGRVVERAGIAARQPVTWVSVGAAVVVLLLLRGILLGGTFTLGELRALPTFADAVGDYFGRVRREGVDPFGPAAPGSILLGAVRSLLGRGPLAEKVVLLAPMAVAGLSGVGLGRVLGFGPGGRRWVAVAAAVNPVTLVLLRDGALGALVLWAASLWVVASLLSPPDAPAGRDMKVRFVARWALAFAVVVALHPQAFVWLAVLGAAVAAARGGDGGTRMRVRILGTGLAGAFLLLIPWSIEWFTMRSPLFGRGGWLVNAPGTGLDNASLGASWPLPAWIVLAVAAAIFVGLSRTTLVLIGLSGFALLASSVGLLGRQTMLAAAGACALVVITVVARRIIEELPRYELGGRQAAVIGGVAACAVVWFGGVVHTVPDGVRSRDLPIVAGVRGEETGRVLWLAQTSGGVRSWTTLSFTEQLREFPAPAGPEERLVTRAVESARAGRTHRLGGILALADVSHIVSLDGESRRGLGGQADLAPQEQQGTATIFRNDAWRGPAMLLSAPPTAPLDPAGLADILREQTAVEVSGWPFGPVSVHAPEAELEEGSVVYLAGGRRGGLRVESTRGRTAAAGSWMPADEVGEVARVALPGRWWRWMLPFQAAGVLGLVIAWLVAAYVGAPTAPAPQLSAQARRATSRRMGILTGALVAGGLVVGWTGLAWGMGTPFLSAAWYCPPAGEGFSQRIGIANPNSSGVPYLVRPDLQSAPFADDRIDGLGRETMDIDPLAGAVIESYGRRLVVAMEVEREGDTDASLCTSQTRELNIFPEGGRAATRARERLFERYVIYNPFPDLARASVRFVSPDETISPPALQDVSIEPGSFVLVDPEEQFEPMLDLSTTVRVWQGRAIVARRLRTEVQVSWSLSTEETTRGVLPRAQTESAITNLIAVNPGEQPATVTLSGAGETESFPEERFEVAPGGRTDFALAALGVRASDLVVSVASDRPVAIESLVAPDDRGTVSLMGPLAAERRWVAPMAEGRELLVTNPGSAPVRVSIERLVTGGREPGAADETLTIEANRVARIALGDDDEFGLIITSTGGGVVASVVGPRGSIPAVPF